jgi:phosphohistidine phosphatase SixA
MSPGTHRTSSALLTTIRKPIHMRFWYVVLLAGVQACAATQSTRVSPVTAGTTVIVVRHAEKSTDDPRDPSLSPEGISRARTLSALLKNAGVADIYVTQYKRTRQTAEPLAQQFGIAIMERPITAANSATYARDLAQEILTRSAGKGVLVVGHSNTVPDIVKALSGTAVPAIADPEYDHIFVVVVPSSGSARLMQLGFEPPSS